MSQRDGDYPLPHGRLGGTVSVSISPHGLQPRTRLGSSGLLRWEWFQRAAWQNDGSVALTLRDFDTLLLPADTERLGELLAAVEHYAGEASAQAIAEACDGDHVRRALGLRAGQVWRPWRAASGPSGLALPLLALFVATPLGMLTGSIALACLLNVLAIVLMELLVAPAGTLPDCGLRADGETLAWHNDQARQELAWADLRGVRIEHEGSGRGRRLMLRLRTTRDELWLNVPALGTRPLIALVSEIVAAHEQRFQPAGARPPSPRALSLARATEGGADRGLSQSSSKSLDA